MLVGTDIGNGASKFTFKEGRKKIASRIKQGHTPMNNSIYNVDYNNNSLTVGGYDGEMDMDNEKYTREFHDILLLTGIGAIAPQDMQKINANIVTGLPVEYYLTKENRTDYKEKLLELGRKKIVINDVDKEILIKNVIVFPQSAVVWKDTSKYRGCKTLVGDIGAGTFDISVWNGLDLEQGKSFPLGVHKRLFKDLATSINGMSGNDYAPHELDEIIGKNFVYDKRRNKVDITKAKEDHINSYYRDLVNTMNNFYKIGNVDEVIITGGGSYLVKDLYKKDFSNISIETEQFINSDVYYKIGEAKGMSK